MTNEIIVTTLEGMAGAVKAALNKDIKVRYTTAADFKQPELKKEK